MRCVSFSRVVDLFPLEFLVFPTCLLCGFRQRQQRARKHHVQVLSARLPERGRDAEPPALLLLPRSRDPRGRGRAQSQGAHRARARAHNPALPLTRTRAITHVSTHTHTSAWTRTHTCMDRLTQTEVPVPCSLFVTFPTQHLFCVWPLFCTSQLACAPGSRFVVADHRGQQRPGDPVRHGVGSVPDHACAPGQSGGGRCSVLLATKGTNMSTHVVSDQLVSFSVGTASRLLTQFGVHLCFRDFRSDRQCCQSLHLVIASTRVEQEQGKVFSAR